MSIEAMTNIITRRATLQGIGMTALGLAGAALLGCGESAKPTGDIGDKSAATAGGGGQGLPMVAPVNAGKPRKGGSFAQSIGTITWVQHDSHTQLGASEWHVMSEKTIELHPVTQQLLPSVAASWEVADPSGTSLIFKVKPGLKMHNIAPWNGRDFNAQDLAWNFERIGAMYAERLKVPASSFQRASMVANITKAEAVDPLTVKVSLSKPNSGFFNGVAENRVMLMPKEMDDIGYNDPMKFGSMGPFQMAEYTKDQQERFKRFDGYSRPGEPSFDEVVLRVIPDPSSVLAAFISGQIQLYSALPADIDTVRKAKPDAQLYTWIDSNWPHFRPNMSYEPFADFRVRKAIHLAMDYAAINDGYFGPGWGYQAALNPGFPEAWKPDKVKSLPGWNPATKTQDRAEAVKLLAAAGFPGGKGIDFGVTYTFSPGSYITENATRLQAQMKEVFPDMKLTLDGLPPGAAFATRQDSGQFKMVAYVITAAPDPVIEMISQYRTGGSRNYGKFSNPDLDGMLDKAIVELNKDARQKLLDDFQTRWVNEWLPNYVLCALPVRNMVQGDIGGYDKSAGTWYGYSSWTKPARWYYVDK